MARDVWAYVQEVDLTELLQRIKAVSGDVGRNATDPRILLAVWLYAFADKQGSRSRAWLGSVSATGPMRWLCGGVTLNYHLLADFRTGHWDYLNNLFTDSLAAALMHRGLVDARSDVPQRRHAHHALAAGKSSFRRQATLEQCLVEAKERVRQVNEEFGQGTAATSKREQAAQKRWLLTSECNACTTPWNRSRSWRRSGKYARKAQEMKRERRARMGMPAT